MDIILKEDIKGLGYKNDIISVKSGYGRNFLIPSGKAIVGSDQNKKIVAENVKQASHKAAKLKDDAQAIAKKVEDLTLKIPTKVGDNGKLFGTITQLQLADLMKENGLEIDRRDINMGSKDKIKELGSYTATLDLHKEVKATLTFEVVAE